MPWRARAMLAATLLGVREAGFLVPYRHAASARPITYPAVAERLAAARPAMAATLAALEELAPDLATLGGAAPAPRFEQDWFPRLDGAVAYTLVRTRRPRRIVEIGSGHSTRFMARAIADGGLPTELACIDPAPRAALAGLDVRHHACTLQDAPAGLLKGLGPGDVAFIDSSHVAMPGSDVDLFFNDVLPRLASGVLVHVHDVFLPDPYPEAWAWRGYNEQLLVALAVTAGRLEPLFASRYVTMHAPEFLEGGAVLRLPLPAGALETSFWGVVR